MCVSSLLEYLQNFHGKIDILTVGLERITINILIKLQVRATGIHYETVSYLSHKEIIPNHMYCCNVCPSEASFALNYDL